MSNDEKPLDDALKRLSASSPPAAPANVEQNVWRRIRQAMAEDGASDADWRPRFWPQWLTQPTFALGLIIVSGALGVLFSSAYASRATPSEGSAVYDSLTVFSDRALGMIQTVITESA